MAGRQVSHYGSYSYFTECEKFKTKQNITKSPQLPSPPSNSDKRWNMRKIIHGGNQHWGRHKYKYKHPYFLFMNALYMTELSKQHLRSNSKMPDRQV